MNLAAIDIGSNAARLLISQAEPYSEDTVDYTKLSLIRIPLRLGMDVFKLGYIGKEREEQMIDSLKAYNLMMKIYKVEAYKACATSAMRDAKNGAEIMKRVKEETGLDIQIITGQEEANILYETHIADSLTDHRSYLYIDVGGGSTEITLYSNKQVVFKESFNIGTIRLLQETVQPETWIALKAYVKKGVDDYGPVEAIGTGGNINKIFSISRVKDGKPLSLDQLRKYYKDLCNLTVAERMHRYQLRADRADVIVPALHIYISIMRWAGADEILVPKIGLADGLVKMLYQERMAGIPLIR